MASLIGMGQIKLNLSGLQRFEVRCNKRDTLPDLKLKFGHEVFTLSPCDYIMEEGGRYVSMLMEAPDDFLCQGTGFL